MTVATLTELSQAGETVDQLVWRVLGRGASAVEAVLEDNPGLADLGLFLPRGVAVRIPVASAGPAVTPLVQLWT